MVDVFSNCTGTVNEQRKTVQSPKLNPGNYLNVFYCTWRIKVPMTKQIKLNFKYFDTKPEVEHLDITDGSSNQDDNLLASVSWFRP